jgi:DNA mismatch endonuclease (patch repair protein)
MRANRCVDTAPERALRAALHARGRRYRVNHRMVIAGVAVRPDIVFTRQRLAVFVDGCFWHGCPSHMSWPKSNRDFWKAKIDKNRERDREQDRLLRTAGWTVIRVWEHEDVENALARIQNVLDGLD